MTNGENILNGFSNATIRKCKNKDFTYIEVEQNDKWIADFNIEWWNSEYKEPTTRNDIAQECYQDLIEYFGDKKVAKTILEDRKEFKAWLERVKWHIKRADELARELERIKETTKNDLPHC